MSEESNQEDHRYRISYLPTDQSYFNLLPTIEGKPLNLEGLEGFKGLGFQASKLYEAFLLLKNAYLQGNTTFVLAFPSNLISSGLRDYVTLLTKKKLVDVIVTTAGGIEEDLIKTRFPFKYTSGFVNDVDLYQRGINRTENVYISNASYVWLESFLESLFKKYPELYSTTPVDLVNRLGEEVKDESSYLHWAIKNRLLVIPLCMEDGAIGDFYANQTYSRLVQNKPLPVLNSVNNLIRYLDYNFQKPDHKIFVIAVGGNAPKHFAMNGLIPFKGADYVVYLNNEYHQFGSNAGAIPEESKSWGKSKTTAKVVKVHGDFMFTFPLLVSAVLKVKRV